jgi:hypothetical protein
MATTTPGALEIQTLEQFDGLLASLRGAGVVKFEGFGVSLLMGPQAQRAAAQASAPEKLPPLPPAPIPITPTVADVERLEAELFEGQS